MRFIHIFLVLVIILWNGPLAEGIVIKRTSTIDSSSQANQLSGSSNGGGGGGSSHDHISSMIPETESFNLTRDIVSPKRDEGFFNESSEVIAIAIKITSLSKDGLKNLEFWEIPSNGLKIINCSYPLRTSKIMDVLEYYNHDKSIIQGEDLINISYIKGKLINDSLSPPYSHIYSLLSEDTKLMLKKNDSDYNGKLSGLILKDFNIIVNNATDQDFNISHLSDSDVVRRSSIYLADNNGYYQGFNNNSKSFLMMNDYRLFKRRLLEDLFPKGIRRINYYKAHENLPPNNLNIITIDKNQIGNSYLRNGESIIFKYYLIPNKIGSSEIHSIIKADGIYREYRSPINIIEREPQFEVGYICPSKELVKNKATEFIYNIKYVGGDDLQKSFDILIKPVLNCTVFPSKLNKTFSKGKTENFAVNVTYIQEGYRLSPPIISINGKEEKFEPDIYVFKEDDLPARLHYEKLALDAQTESNSINKSLLYLSIISIFFIILEFLYLIYVEEKARKEKMDTNKAFEGLERALNKISDKK